MEVINCELKMNVINYDINKNIDILKELMFRVKTINKIVKHQNLKIIRTVEPDSKNFKSIHERVNNIISQKISKKRNSMHLITTEQFLQIMHDDKNEKSKIDILKNRIYEINRVVDVSSTPLSVQRLNLIFTNNINFQKIIINSDFEPKSFNNNLNEIVNVFKFSNEDLYDNSLKSKFLTSNDIDLYKYRCDSILDFLNYFLNIDLELSDAIYENEDSNIFIEYINSLNPSVLFNNLSKVFNELDKVENLCDEYVNQITISYKKFVQIFPEINNFLENEKKKIDEEVIYKSKLKRKRIKVEITYETEVEIEVIDDDEIVSKINTYLNSDEKLIPSNYYRNDFKIISSNLNNITIL